MTRTLTLVSVGVNRIGMEGNPMETHNWIAVVTFMSLHPRALKEGDNFDLISAAEHDRVYFNADANDIDPESEQGQKLKALGVFYDDSYDCWCKFV